LFDGFHRYSSMIVIITLINPGMLALSPRLHR
jgi:hypothetical protein